MNGAERIVAERKRQIEKEGLNDKHDDNFCKNTLIRAAVCYALPDEIRQVSVGGLVHRWKLLDELWPFENCYWKPTPENRIRELEKAGALIAAEIDKLLREQESKGESTDELWQRNRA